MEILLYFVLVLALVGDVLLAILLVRSSRRRSPRGLPPMTLSTR